MFVKTGTEGPCPCRDSKVFLTMRQQCRPLSHCTDVLVMLPLTKRLVNSVIVVHRYLCNLNYIAKKILNNQRTDLLET